CPIGLESTVLDLSRDPPAILSPGAVTAEMLRGAIGDVDVEQTTVGPHESAISPGLQSRHYAPRTAAYRFGREDWPAVRQWTQEAFPCCSARPRSRKRPVFIGKSRPNWRLTS